VHRRCVECPSERSAIKRSVWANSSTEASANSRVTVSTFITAYPFRERAVPPQAMLAGFQVIVEWLDTAVLGVTARIGVVVEPLRQISPAAIRSLGVSKMARSTASREYSDHCDGQLRPGAVLRLRPHPHWRRRYNGITGRPAIARHEVIKFPPDRYLRCPLPDRRAGARRGHPNFAHEHNVERRAELLENPEADSDAATAMPGPLAARL